MAVRYSHVVAVAEIVSQIASSLGETDARPLSQIAEIVALLGEQESLGVLARTQIVEQSGGMTLPDGRRRTSGGVFFKLAKKQLSFADVQRIFAAPDATAAVPTMQQPSPAPPAIVAESVVTGEARVAPSVAAESPHEQTLVRIPARAKASSPAVAPARPGVGERHHAPDVVDHVPPEAHAARRSEPAVRSDDAAVDATVAKLRTELRSFAPDVRAEIVARLAEPDAPADDALIELRSFERDVRIASQRFVAALGALYREAAIEAVREQFGLVASPAPPQGARAAATPVKKPKPASRAKAHRATEHKVPDLVHISAARRAAASAGLSKAEEDTLVLLLLGLPRVEIGKRMAVSVNTVKSHCRSIFRKLGASRSAQLVADLLGSGSDAAARDTSREKLEAPIRASTPDENVEHGITPGPDALRVDVPMDSETAASHLPP